MQIASANVIYPQRWNYLGIGPEIAKSLVDSGLSPFAQMGANRLGHAIFGNTVAEDQVAQQTRTSKEAMMSDLIAKNAHSSEIARAVDVSPEEAQAAIDHSNSYDALKRTSSQSAAVEGGRGDTVDPNESSQLLSAIGADKTTSPGPKATPPADPTVKVVGDAPASPTSDLFGTPDSTPHVPQAGATDPLVTIRPDNSIQNATNPSQAPPAVLPADTQSAPTVSQAAQSANAQAQATSMPTIAQVSSAFQDPEVRQKASLYVLHNQGLMSQLTQSLTGQLDANDNGKSMLLAGLSQDSYNSMLDALKVKSGIETPGLKALGPAGASMVYLSAQAKDPNTVAFMAKTQGQVAADAFVSQGKAFDAKLASSNLQAPERALLNQEAAQMQLLGSSGIDSAQKLATAYSNLAFANRTTSLIDPEKAKILADIGYTQAQTTRTGVETQGQKIANDQKEKMFPLLYDAAKFDNRFKDILNQKSSQDLDELKQSWTARYDSLLTKNNDLHLGLTTTQLHQALVAEQVSAAHTKSYLAPQIGIMGQYTKRLSDNTASIKDLQDNITKLEISGETNAYTTDEAKSKALATKELYGKQLGVFNAERKDLITKMGAVTQTINEYHPDKTIRLRQIFDENNFQKDPTYWSLRTSSKPEYFPGSLIAENMSRAGTTLGKTKGSLPSLDYIKTQFGDRFLKDSNGNQTISDAKIKYAYQILQASYQDANLRR